MCYLTNVFWNEVPYLVLAKLRVADKYFTLDLLLYSIEITGMQNVVNIRAENDGIPTRRALKNRDFSIRFSRTVGGCKSFNE